MEHQPLFKWLLFIFLIHSTYLPTAHSVTIPRLSPFGKWDTTLHDHAALVKVDPNDVKTFYYNQTLDHFNYRPESYQTFQQRYLINFKYWGGASSSAPILAYLGAEAAIDNSPWNTGFMADNAASLKALLVYIEHRYYGKSGPFFGATEEAFNNATTFGYFNSAQALADYAEVLRHIKKTYQAQKSPVIVVGGSYGGMLAAWFRLKYPHMTIGALASSAPLLYFDDLTPQDAYYNVVARDFQEASQTCHQTIRNSWSEILSVASQPNGLSILSQRFNTCHPLNNSSELIDYLESMYTIAAQYNQPPRYPVTIICGGIDGASSGSDIISKIYAGVVAYESYTGNSQCRVNSNGSANVVTNTGLGWRWQKCTEMVIPIGIGNNTMFMPNRPFNLTNFASGCEKQFGVSPRPHWVTTYYGGHNIKLVLQRFGSNIIFSNGLKDPYSAGGVLEGLSDSLVAIYTVNGSHCLDLLPGNPHDPAWLVEQRKKEVDIIQGWTNQYYADLKATPKFQNI